MLNTDEVDDKQVDGNGRIHNFQQPCWETAVFTTFNQHAEKRQFQQILSNAHDTAVSTTFT